MAYCSACGKEVPEVSKFCPGCGHNLLTNPQVESQASANAEQAKIRDLEMQVARMDEREKAGKRPMRKSEGTAVLLAVLFGFVALYGIGHMYVGRIGRGLAILFADWALLTGAALVFLFYMGQGSAVVSMELMTVVALLFALADLIFWVWQIFDARACCKQHNAVLSQSGVVK